MKIIESVAELRQASRTWRRQGIGVGFVPTMGALHAGHLSLVAAARKPGDRVIASVFVNPLQFGAGEDLAGYPRPFDEDRRKLEAAGVDILFHPTVDEMYPVGADTRVSPGAVALPLEGESRPGHFTGVATVVARLLNAAAPDRAYFGQKDAQQLAVIRALVRDLGFPVEIVGCPTVRETDGLAMSSRNGYLDERQRQEALALVRSLARAQSMAAVGASEPESILAAMRADLAGSPGVTLDYVAIVDSSDFSPARAIDQESLAVVAAAVGRARLIDNARVLDSDLLDHLPGAVSRRALEGASAWNA
ncbi:MAG TPA: pantoate--beta-alanine ligase [Candidatus Solibacter sp.]|jgi:pantoate--beta-alanine ligase|nr:pantoate--beta-alanine ligase [Candidatus Solibacter sp.]